MSDSDPLLRKADALMQRHRSYVAGSPAAAPLPVDDLPVLTEVVTGEAPAASAAPVIESTAPADIEAIVEERVRERVAELLPIIRRQFAEELDAWFDEQLPQIVFSLLDGFTDRLVSQISSRARGDLMTWLQTAGESIDITRQPE